MPELSSRLDDSQGILSLKKSKPKNLSPGCHVGRQAPAARASQLTLGGTARPAQQLQHPSFFFFLFLKEKKTKHLHVPGLSPLIAGSQLAGLQSWRQPSPPSPPCQQSVSWPGIKSLTEWPSRIAAVPVFWIASALSWLALQLIGLASQQRWAGVLQG